jgi:hypothetical protein
MSEREWDHVREAVWHLDMACEFHRKTCCCPVCGLRRKAEALEQAGKEVSGIELEQ